MDNAREIMSRLKFIGKIQKGEKINTRYMFVQSDNWITSLYRTIINQDNRMNALEFIQETINRSFDLITILEMSEIESNILLCENIIRDVINSKNGILNIKETYGLDIKFSCDMDTIIQHIDAKLIEISKKYKIEKVTELLHDRILSEKISTIIKMDNVDG